MDVGNKGKYGLLSPLSGKEILPIEYDQIESVCCFGTDYLLNKNETQWSFVRVEPMVTFFDIEGKEVEELPAFIRHPLFLYIDNNYKYNLLDVNGTKILDEDYDEISTCYFYYQYYQVKKNNKYGMVDYKGNILVAAEYDAINFVDDPEEPKMILTKGTQTLKFDLDEIKEKYFDRNLPLEI